MTNDQEWITDLSTVQTLNENDIVEVHLASGAISTNKVKFFVWDTNVETFAIDKYRMIQPYVSTVYDGEWVTDLSLLTALHPNDLVQIELENGERDILVSRQALQQTNIKQFRFMSAFDSKVSILETNLFDDHARNAYIQSMLDTYTHHTEYRILNQMTNEFEDIHTIQSKEDLLYLLEDDNIITAKRLSIDDTGYVGEAFLLDRKGTDFTSYCDEYEQHGYDATYLWNPLVTYVRTVSPLVRAFSVYGNKKQQELAKKLIQISADIVANHYYGKGDTSKLVNKSLKKYIKKFNKLISIV